ncbi:hypothetical protein SDC9_205934 [bioreactor metagenome]|uniref:Uncharacterized protein n=1 Tax=bioreactor metagenome TaxID=1076179 RepID=A0A645J3M3_9ZZZZ
MPAQLLRRNREFIPLPGIGYLHVPGDVFTVPVGTVKHQENICRRFLKRFQSDGKHIRLFILESENHRCVCCLSIEFERISSVGSIAFDTWNGFAPDAVSRFKTGVSRNQIRPGKDSSGKAQQGTHE